MGFALAAEAARRGARTHARRRARSASPTPPGVERHDVRTALEMANVVPASRHAADADLIVMAAAVADFRPATYAGREDQAPPGHAADRSGRQPRHPRLACRASPRGRCASASPPRAPSLTEEAAAQARRQGSASARRQRHLAQPTSASGPSRTRSRSSAAMPRRSCSRGARKRRSPARSSIASRPPWRGRSSSGDDA
jgi:hypothetical protein